MESHPENIRMTTQRKVILETLRHSDMHPTADELYEMVRKKLPKISLGTVYRNLEALSEAGLIRKVEFAGCQKRFDKTPTEHYHIRCAKCGRIEDLHCELSEDIEKDIRDATDFEVIGHKIEFIGICPDCRKAGKRKHGAGRD